MIDLLHVAFEHISMVRIKSLSTASMPYILLHLGELFELTEFSRDHTVTCYIFIPKSTFVGLDLFGSQNIGFHKN